MSYDVLDAKIIKLKGWYGMEKTKMIIKMISNIGLTKKERFEIGREFLFQSILFDDEDKTRDDAYKVHMEFDKKIQDISKL